MNNMYNWKRYYKVPQYEGYSVYGLYTGGGYKQNFLLVVVNRCDSGDWKKCECVWVWFECV